MKQRTNSHFDRTIHHDIRTSQGFAKPLKEGEATPACTCPSCTGISADHPARQPKSNPNFSEWEAKAERARSINILEIAQRIGLEYTKRGGDSYFAKCPLHSDTDPSLHLSPAKGRSGLWHCFSCKAGGDGIELFMRHHRMTFAEAVRALL